MANITPNHKWAVRRILIALNSCSNEQATIAATVLLSRQLEAELAGLFVEDVNLLRLAELPFACEILGTHLQKRLFDMAQLQRSMSVEAARLRQALMREAEQHHISWSFLRAQGQLVAETVNATESADLLAIGREFHGAIVGTTPAEMAEKIVRQSCCSVLIDAQQKSKPHKTINIIVDDSSAAMHVLQSGLALAQMEKLPVKLLLVASDSEISEKLKEACLSRIATFQNVVAIDVFPNIADVIEELLSAEPLLLVLGYDALSSDNVVFKKLFQSVSGPILIIR